MGNGVVAGRVLCDAGNYRAFGQVKRIDRFIKIAQGGCLDTQRILSQVDTVHIV